MAKPSSAALLVVIALAAAAATGKSRADKAAPADRCVAETPFGLFGPDRRAVRLDDRLRLYRELGARWVRFNSTIPPSPSHGMSDPTESPRFEGQGGQVFLSVINPTLFSGGTDPGPLDAYAAGLRSAIERYRPAMIAVENEADNAPYTMPAAAYLSELHVACQIAHQQSVACTDSGLTSKMQIALLVEWDLSKGKPDDARRDARFLALWYADHPAPDAAPEDLAAFLQRVGVSRARAMDAGLAAAGADRVDLHWYMRPNPALGEPEQDGLLLGRVIAMLRARTGLPVAAGEVGFDSPHMADAELTADDVEHLATTLARQDARPIIIWNPGAGLFGANPHALSLVDATGNPLPSAEGLQRASAQLHDKFARCAVAP